MDVSRGILDNLMGRDRNKPKGNINDRDHYSNTDVCKPFLVCFCFNTLFPNTTYYQGPCQKRHDTYLKTMFENDLQRANHEKQYIKECIKWIDKKLVDVEEKTKKNQSTIDNKTTFTSDRPKQVLDRVIAIDEDIDKMMQQAQVFGDQGQIDDSARCLEEIEKLRQRRKQIEMMGDSMLNNNTQKQQKICEICGAIQTVNDTQKRIQTHLEGKIHQGFLKLRHEIETLKVRLEILNKLDPNRKEEPIRASEKEIIKKKQRSVSPKKKKERERQRQRSRDKEHKKQKKEQDRERDRQRERERQRQRQRQRQKDKERDKDRYKHHKEHREYRDYRDHRDYEKNGDKNRHDHKKRHKKDRSRSGDDRQKRVGYGYLQ